MAKVLYPDSPSYEFEYDRPDIFLAGSIDNGAASLWAQTVISHLKDTDVILYNPRRKVWDPAMEQSIANPIFVEQVEWELQHLTECDIPFFYFEPGSLSPITLQELGFICGLNTNPFPPIVCCPDGFWRKGNVEIMCSMYGLPVYNDLSSALEGLEYFISDCLEAFY